MRIWSLHPVYLDQKGLVACWRETLLAQKVLQGATKGYRNHPQLLRFREQADPLAAIGRYLSGIHDEAVARGYNFDRSKIIRNGPASDMDVAVGQLTYELSHLRAKLELRDPGRLAHLPTADSDIRPHPMFRVVEGGVADWERP